MLHLLLEQRQSHYLVSSQIHPRRRLMAVDDGYMVATRSQKAKSPTGEAGLSA